MLTTQIWDNFFSFLSLCSEIPPGLWEDVALVSEPSPQVLPNRPVFVPTTSGHYPEKVAPRGSASQACSVANLMPLTLGSVRLFVPAQRTKAGRGDFLHRWAGRRVGKEGATTNQSPCVLSSTLPDPGWLCPNNRGTCLWYLGGHLSQGSQGGLLQKMKRDGSEWCLQASGEWLSPLLRSQLA